MRCINGPLCIICVQLTIFVMLNTSIVVYANTKSKLLATIAAELLQTLKNDGKKQKINE